MWFQVKDHDLKPPVHPHEFLIQKIETIQPAKQVVGLLTSAKLTNYVEQSLAFGDYWVRVLATVGLGNALRAGDPPGPSGRIGTINLACQTSHRLSSEAMLESLSLMAEAKAAAVADGGVISRQSGRPATGTGTDCHVIATPMNAPKEVYAGKHTKIGYLIGESVYQAVSQGIMRWKGDHPDSKLIVPT
jgi:adenosylcobinamide amidohydrolase